MKKAAAAEAAVEHPIQLETPVITKLLETPTNYKPGLLFQKLNPDAIIPEYQTQHSCGVDLHVCTDTNLIKTKNDFVILNPGDMYMFKTGLAVEVLAHNAAPFIFSRSGLGAKKGIVVAQGVGVIDPDYRGELGIPLRNIGKDWVKISYGDRVAQLVLMAFTQAIINEVSDLSETQRGGGGFGSTGQ